MLCRNERPTVAGQILVEEIHESPCFGHVRTHHWMNHFAEEQKKGLVVSVHKIEAAVREDPIVRPVFGIVDAVLPDVPCGITEAPVCRGYSPKVPKPLQERGLLKASASVGLLDGDGVKDVPTGDLGDGRWRDTRYSRHPSIVARGIVAGHRRAQRGSRLTGHQQATQ